MKRFPILLFVILTAARTVAGQASRPAPDVRTFELTPAAPTQPALARQLLFGFADRIPGNAAIAYLDAILLMGNETNANAEKALKAFESKDIDTFNSLADTLALPALFDELDVAGRRGDCDWQPPVRERGPMTLLPHLSPLANGVTNAIRVRALRQISQGKIDDALATLRLGYELGEKVGREPVLVSALVSMRITSRMNDTLAELMNRAESPNLYWALSELPSRRAILRHAWDQEHRWLLYSAPLLATVQAGGELTAEQWRTVLIDEMAPMYQIYENYKYVGKRPHADPIKDPTPEVQRQARDEYAKSHNITADQVAQIDPAIVLGNFYFREWQIAADEVAKLRGLPYLAMLRGAADLKPKLERLRREQRSNPFLEMVSDLGSSISSVGRTDRQIAALTAVESIRAYAAANGGVLPQKLDDISDPPVSVNPLTGKSFEYQLAEDLPVATLADTQSDVPLRYTIKLRK